MEILAIPVKDSVITVMDIDRPAWVVHRMPYDGELVYPTLLRLERIAWFYAKTLPLLKI